jgi:HK97 family phage major capsid protein
MNKAELYNKKSSIISKMEELKQKNKNTWNDTDQDDFVGLGEELEVIDTEIRMQESVEIDDVLNSTGKPFSVTPGSEEGERMKPETFTNTRGQKFEVYDRTNYKDSLQKPRLASLGTIIRSWITKPMNKLEERALGEGTATAGQELTFADHLNDFIPYLFPFSAVLPAGAKIIKLGTDSTVIPRVTSIPTIAWRAENAAVTESDPAFDSVTFAPESLAVLFKVSNELLADSPIVDKAIQRTLAGTFAAEIDQTCLAGTGTSNQPAEVVNFSGISSTSMTGTSGSVPTTWDPFVNLTRTLEYSNAGPATAIIAHPRTWSDLSKLKDTSGQYIEPSPYLRGVQLLATTSVGITDTKGASSSCSKAICGDFKDMYIGMRSKLVIRKLTERYADYNQTGIVAIVRMDVQPYHVASFTYLDSIRGSST